MGPFTGNNALISANLEDSFDASNRQKPSPCTCSPELSIPYTRAVATLAKKGYLEFSAAGASANRRHLTKTTTVSGNVYTAGSFQNNFVIDAGTETGSFSSTAVQKINPLTNAEVLESISGTQSIRRDRTVTWIHEDPEPEGWDGGTNVTLDLTSNAVRTGPNLWAWTGAGDIWGVYYPTNTRLLISDTLTPTSRTRVWAIKKFAIVGAAGPNETIGTLTETTTLSEVYTNEALESAANALLSAAEAKAQDVWWDAIATTYRLAVSATYEPISQVAANAGVTAAQAAVTTAQAAVAAVHGLNTWNLRAAQNALGVANLRLELATHNATQVSNTDAPIVFSFPTESMGPEAFHTAGEDGQWITISSLRYILGARVSNNWDYMETPVAHKFRWREAAWSQEAEEPVFTAKEQTVANAFTLRRFFPPSTYVNYSIAELPEPQTLAAPAAPGRQTLASPNADGEPHQHLGSWVPFVRSAAMSKIGFPGHGEPASPPVFYRRETFSGNVTGFHEMFLYEEDGTQSYYYESANLPDPIDPAILSPWSSDYTPHVRAVFVPGETSTSRTHGAGASATVAVLSNPWTTGEITAPVTANVQAPLDDAAPPYPDTAALFFGPPGNLPFAVRWLTADESYFVLGRCSYASHFTLPESARYAPAFADGRSVLWQYEKITRNLTTGATTKEDMSETVSYAESEYAKSVVWPYTSELAAPTTNAQLVWLTRPYTSDVWSWGLPQCRPVC